MKYFGARNQEVPPHLVIVDFVNSKFQVKGAPSASPNFNCSVFAIDAGN
jgi:hypothetical protein